MGKSILIVEDDRVIQEIIEWRLNQLGYTICGKSATAEGAYNLVKEKKPDAVLMDITLEGFTDGIDAAIEIKKMYPVPIIFLTSDAKDEDLNRAKMVHPSGFIVKPFNDTDLRVALALALPQAK